MHIVIDARARRASTGRYTDRLIQHLQTIDTKNTYTVLTQPDDDWRPSANNFSRQSCGFRQFSFNPVDQVRFARQLYRLKADVVHFTMTQQPLMYFGRIVTTTHDLTMLRFTRASRFPGPVHALGMMLYRSLLWIAHRKSRRIIVPSQYVAQDLSTYQPFTKDKLVVTYEASEPPLTITAKQPQGISQPFIFHIGNPLPHKNIHRLIDAFAKIKQSNPDLQLVLPGKFSGVFEQDIYAYIARSPCKDSIITPGFVSDAELKWLYQNAGCYALPSLSEGFGLPGLEAMAHGCPLVSSNATCLPEIYQDAAHYFNPLDSADMAAKINDVLTKPAIRKQLIDRAPRVISQYSWATMAKQTLRVYQEAAHGTK